VAIAGLPNVGKSTLLNALLGEKLAIVAPRPQTTRNRILGVRNLPGAQLVLVDTPGLHRPAGRGRSRLNTFMMHEATSALSDTDVALLLVEAPQNLVEANRPAQGAGDRFALEELRRLGKPVVLAVNKVDALRDKRLLLPFLEGWSRAFEFAAVVPISALRGEGIDRLEEVLTGLVPEGGALFPEEMLTDRAERWLGAELIREQLFLRTHEEVPYSVAVTIDEWIERPARGERQADVQVSATISVEKEAQKRIVVGEGGAMVRDIGTAARAEMARLVGCPVHLTLFVRVDEGWTESPRALEELGYE
jgi:GTP-binding protein Era